MHTYIFSMVLLKLAHDVIFNAEASENNIFLFDADIKIRVLTPKDTPLVLECANKSDKVQWQKEKMPLSIAGNEDIKIDNDTGNLLILKDKKEAYGNYTCKLGTNSTIEYRVVREYSTIHILHNFISNIKNNKRILYKTYYMYSIILL